MIRSAIATTILVVALSTAASATGWRPGANTVDTAPPAASAAGKPACAPVAEYMRRVQTGETAKMGDLFAEDGVFLVPNGQVLKGRDAINAFFSRMAGHKTEAVAFNYVAEGSQCVMEMAGRHDPKNPTGPFTLSSDFVLVDGNGKIKQLIVYILPNPAPAK